MSRPVQVRLAWSLFAFCGLVALLMVALGALAAALPIVAFTLMGALVIARRGNPIGWVFCATGVACSLDWGGSELAQYALLDHPGSVTGGRVFALITNSAQVPAFCLLGCVLLVFPSGRVATRRQRLVLRGLYSTAVVGGLAYLLGEGAFEDPFQAFSNPIGIPRSHGLLSVVAGLSWMACLVFVFCAAVSIVARLRLARGLERLQLKWVVYAGAMLAAVFVVSFPTFFFYDHVSSTVDSVRSGAFTVAFAGIPAAAGVAILRHRLYDIDVVINRTLVYVSLTATLAAVYVGSVLLLQLALDPVTSGSNLAVAVSTLAVAAAFRPARARIQAVVDRRFYRRKYDAARTLEGFSARLREQVDLDALGSDLRGVVRETMQPAHVSLWLRGGARR
jgi:hypothetical protein